MMTHVVFTGGGTAGHVNPNIALMDGLREKGCTLSYIGSDKGVERAMVALHQVPYYAVRSGKLRRYFSWQNFIDPLNLLIGVIQSYVILRRLKPNVVFSKGGFVALPVVVGAWLNRIPVIAHESDLTPGLANRLSLPFVNHLCVTFSGSKAALSQHDKVQVTGTPIRERLMNGTRDRGLLLCGFDGLKPCLLVMGGSQGSEALNTSIRAALPRLNEHYDVIHLCGKGKLDPAFLNYPGYKQFEYVEDDLGDLLAACDVIVSRAGANALCEILACEKPHVLVPLPRHSSRGDQIENARYFEEKGISVVLDEARLTPDTLLEALHHVESSKELIKTKISALQLKSATGKIIELILQTRSIVPDR